MFYILENTLFSYPIQPNYPAEPALFLKDINATNIAISPHQNAFLLYSLNSPTFSVYYLQAGVDQLKVVNVGSPIISIDFLITTYISVITASEDQTIRIFTESQYSTDFSCTATFYIDFPILKIITCISRNVRKENEKVSPLSIPNSFIFPSFPKEEHLVQITVDNPEKNTIFMQIRANSLIRIIGSINIPKNYTLPFECDLLHSCDQQKYSCSIYTTSMNKYGLYFGVFKFADAISFYPLYNITFIFGEVKKFINHSLKIEQTDGTILDLNTLNHHKLEKIENKIIKIGNLDFNFNFEITVSDYIQYDNQIMIVACGKQKNLVIFTNSQNDLKILEINGIEDEVTGVSIHSTDLFLVTTANSLEIFYYEIGNKFIKIASKQGKNMKAVFVPNDIPTLFICENQVATLNIINNFEISDPIATFKIPSYKLIDTLTDGTIVAATNSSIDHLTVPNEFFPKIFDGNSDFVRQTEFCLGVIPDNPNESIEKCMKILPQNWEIFDPCSKRFLIPYFFRNFIDMPSIAMEMFSIWASLSPRQELLFNFMNIKSVDELIESYVHFWARDAESLKNFVGSFVATHQIINDKTVDIFAMLSVACGKNAIASKTFSKFGNETLANFLLQTKDNSSQRKAKIMKNAYAALKVHRYFLAAMFFILNQDFQDAIQSLNLYPNYQILIQRLLDQPIEKSGILGNWLNNDKNEAMKLLFEKRLPKCNSISLEYIRGEILFKMNYQSRVTLLRLQETPYFIEKILEISKNFSSDDYYNADIAEIIEKQPSSEAKEEEEDDSSEDFDFGSKFDDDFEDYDDYEDEDTKEDAKYNIGYTITKKFVDLQPKTFISNFLSKQKNSEKLTILPSDQRLAFLLSSLFAQPKSEIAEQLIDMSYKIDKTVQISIIFCVLYVNGNYCFLNLLDMELARKYIDNEMKKSEVINHMEVPFFFKCSANDKFNIQFSIFTVLQEFISKIISRDYPLVIAVIVRKYETMFYQCNRFFVSNFYLAHTLQKVHPSLLENIENSERARKSIEYVTSMKYDTMSPFISTAIVKMREMDFPTEKSVTSLCYFGETNPTIAYISDGSLQFISLEIQEIELVDFVSPLLNLLPEVVKQDYEKQKVKSEMFNIRWGPEIISNKYTCLDGRRNSEFFIVGSEDGILSLGFERFITNSLKISSYPLKKIKFNAKGDHIAVVDTVGDLYLACVYKMNVEKVASSIDNFDWLNNDTQFVCISSSRETVIFYDVISGYHPINEFPLQHQPSKYMPIVKLRSDIFYGCEDGSLSMFDMTTGGYSQFMKNHLNAITCLESSPSESFFVSSCESGTVYIQYKKAKNIAVIPLHAFGEKVNCLHVSKRVICIGSAHGVKCWVRDEI
ncbi:hypothetical protein TVAG_113390 [Trichomonas vaginalis G3]|uniref:Uncharacterized protein n=1 Tax=Trichomonas vaginalis (strain ATCC PRA-98 / G3) TaxID=412133 RepID=A2DNJ2_TRIV3|nr:Rabconnectin-related family [Trichomonas vaginalis G3]EAY17995.1 hypothetical protein TVAG_113390 [Trichomonas vaginalis G3]KAI5524443.1 Rabconnectin-related family [Trichomonas vaginalis G3]|eukprot:XP_001578981.1 hypothetical protein [Trichomonas vaginalis G3]